MRAGFESGVLPSDAQSVGFWVWLHQGSRCLEGPTQSEWIAAPVPVQKRSSPRPEPGQRNLFASDVTYYVQAADGLGGAWANLCTYTAAAGWARISPEATVFERATQGSAPDQAVEVVVTDAAAVSSRAERFFRVSIQR